MEQKDKFHLDLPDGELRRLWAKTLDALEHYPKRMCELPIAPTVEQDELLAQLGGFDFLSARKPEDVVGFVLSHMESSQMHTSSPSYFGVFNPLAAPMGVLGETIAASYNAQLASWTSSPFLIEVEQHLLRYFGGLFGFTNAHGTFTSGGTEANLTGVLTALHARFPELKENGLRSLTKLPRLYVSEEGHHSFEKAAIITGLGSAAVRRIPVDDSLRMNVKALSLAIEEDRSRGFEPFLVVATLGTTNAGVVDSLAPIGEAARSEGLRLHLDAAWGGAAVLLPELESLFQGSAAADSITLDAHKWLNVPMTAGMYLTRHADELEKTFRVQSGHYMPVSSERSERHQPYAESLMWSRRSMGLKLFMTLASAGRDGYRETIRHQILMGNQLRAMLERKGWLLHNETELPVICFSDRAGRSAAEIEAMAKRVADQGGWVTTVQLSNGVNALRAGISNYRTVERHLDWLMEILEEARKCVA